MGKYVLSPQAQRSLRKIKQYSKEQFGAAQTNLYLEQLKQAMQSSADKPSTGISRSDIKAGYLSKSINSHVIFYRKNGSNIDIIDVLHQRMDYIRHL